MRIILTSLLVLSSQLAAVQLQAADSDSSIIHQIYRHVDERNAQSEDFVQALQSNDRQLQTTALIGLGRVGDKTSIPTLGSFLAHKDPEIRRAAAFGLGQMQDKSAAAPLWQQLQKETDVFVKRELYLGLGKLGDDQVIEKLLAHLSKESFPRSRADLFQALSIALVFHSDLAVDYQSIDYAGMLKILSKGDEYSAMAGFFLNRIPDIASHITSVQLLAISENQLSIPAQISLARLFGKTTAMPSPKDRDVLAWLIEASNSSNQNLSIEAARSMRHLMQIPQTLIQLGKLQASDTPVVAQTALKVIADSEMNTPDITSLLKSRLKSDRPELVVEAINGLVKRQQRDEMSWVLTLAKNPSAFVKINLIDALKRKSETEFNNTLKFFSQDPNLEVAAYAQLRLADAKPPKATASETPLFSRVQPAVGKKVTLVTSAGRITLEMLADAPYTAWHFVENAKQGVYDLTYFSRVIGNFVAQGGDSLGDRSGSTNITIREEISYLSHAPMTVGIATLGKDTGTSQFFINTANNPHLDRNYTIFAKVIAGQDVAMSMANGTRILKTIVE